MHLDPSKLDELAELADGDLEFVADLLETYLDDALPRTQSLREALLAGDIDSAAALAHALKAGSANVGATTIAGHFAQIEEAGRLGSMDTIQSTLDLWHKDLKAPSLRSESGLRNTQPTSSSAAPSNRPMAQGADFRISALTPL